jgi:hypothetical protein
VDDDPTSSPTDSTPPPRPSLRMSSTAHVTALFFSELCMTLRIRPRRLGEMRR